MKIPNNWNEITVGQYVELSKLDSQDFESSIDYNLEKLAVITNSTIDDDYWNDMDVLELNKIITDSSFLNKPITSKVKKEINNSFILMNFKTITLGEFIDCEAFLKDKIENFTKLLAIFYRKTKDESYASINLNERAEEFEDFYITDVYGSFNAFINFREEFFKKYAPLFEPEFDTEEELDENLKNDPIYLAQQEEDKAYYEKQKKWSWVHFCYQLAGEDILKIKDITKLNLIFVFNILAMKKELKLS